jgi:arabinose-5-phosphate isomerase
MSDGTETPRTAETRGLSDDDLLRMARDVLAVERDAIDAVSARLGNGFVEAVRAIVDCRGSIVVCGAGKSGLVARKIAATFASTGTRAFFLHPADAAHGDVGMVAAGDVVVAISKSGEADELLDLLPLVREIGVTLISITGATGSTLASRSDIVIDSRVER